MCNSNLGLLAAPPSRTTGYSPHTTNPAPPIWEDAANAAQLQSQEYGIPQEPRLPGNSSVEQSQSTQCGKTPGMETAAKEAGWSKTIQELDNDEAFAARLQDEEFGIGDDDAAFASQLEEDDKQDSEQLEREQQHTLRVQRDAEETAMMLSSSGVAWKLVEQVTQLALSLNFAPVGIDDMVDNRLERRHSVRRETSLLT
jgi:hypothetical protein